MREAELDDTNRANTSRREVEETAIMNAVNTPSRSRDAISTFGLPLIRWFIAAMASAPTPRFTQWRWGGFNAGEGVGVDL